MKWSAFFTSSIGKKFIVALTGIFLILFLIVHAGLNACIWANDNGEMFNKAAHFMGNTVVIRILEIGLFVIFFIHIIQTYILTAQNQRRRQTGYAIKLGDRGSKWYSRNMGLLGTLILLFLIIHIYHFWTPSRLGGIGNIHSLDEVSYNDGAVTIHNLYAEMQKVFENPLIVVLYVLGCFSLAYHLMHGFKSAFRTLGVNNKRYFSLVKGIGFWFSIIVPLVFAMMPISIYLHWIE